MAFSEYRKYSMAELKVIFNVKVLKNKNLFDGFKRSDWDYQTLQTTVEKMNFRINLSKSDNEATRGSLLVSHILWKASDVYDLGIFFEPQVDITQEETPDLPHSLNGKYDCALSLDDIDFISPIISVVEVKKSNLSEGLGQCLAEMVATSKKFKQNKVYGIITDGEVWEFFLLENNAILHIDEKNYYINNVSDIVDRIGYIAERFKPKSGN
jgi:hypothetical protein